MGSLRNDSQLNTPKAILIDLIRAAAGVSDYPRAWTDSADHAAKYQRSALAFSKKLAMFWLVFGLCWKVLEKEGVAIRHFGMPAQLTSHWRRQIVRISLRIAAAALLVCGGGVVAAESDG
ncbi:integral membrane protein AefA [Salmonella enterica subsp. enterica]|uniref:Integral membrane protein AefA n=1 Tax=Salmonella enterica I TaxID=59201 RepID=A0A379WZ87_SALET|nr:integral membrane protein AefA [Salmonella enterica subsp. enterica]